MTDEAIEQTDELLVLRVDDRNPGFEIGVPREDVYRFRHCSTGLNVGVMHDGPGVRGGLECSMGL